MSAEADITSGAARRARLVHVARACESGRARRVAGGGVPFARLAAPPAWLRPEGREAAPAMMGLLTVAPALRLCVDGRVLGPLAERFGDAALEAALGAAEEGADQADAVAHAPLPCPDQVAASGEAFFARAVAGEASMMRLADRAVRATREAE